MEDPGAGGARARMAMDGSDRVAGDATRSVVAHVATARPSGSAVEVLQWTTEHLAVGEVVVAGALERLDHADVAGVAVAADLRRPGVDKDSRSAGHGGGGVAVTASGRCD